METKYFFLKLNPSRADFAQTMSDEEREIMNQHLVYWKGLKEKGKVLVYGPVFDPKATYGIGVVAATSIKEIEELISFDPAIKINTYEYYPMMAISPYIPEQ